MTDLLATIAKRRDLSVFAAAIKIAGLDQVVTSDVGEFTIFAPTDSAFTKLTERGDNFLDRNIWLVTEIVTLHTIFGRFDYEDLLKICDRDTPKVTVMAIDGSPLEIDISNGVAIERAKVISSDPSSSNGTLHIIDRVIVPSAYTFSL